MTRKGRQEPTFEHVGIYALTDGPDAVSLFGRYGVRFIPAQAYEMDLYLAKNEIGEVEALTIGLSRPRQYGKSFAARYYALWCAFIEGKSVLYSAHNGTTTRKMFKFMCDFIAAHDDFRRKLRPGRLGIYKAQGSEGVYLSDGPCIEFSTRINSGARGGTYDVIIVDEAQELTDEQRDAMMPTNIASDSGDPQTIYIGTPPNHKCPGAVFRDLHEAAHGGTLGDAWWIEWAATEIGDPMDADRWYECNPMMGYRIKERSMRNAALSMVKTPDSFAREHLGWWDRSVLDAEKVISPDEWDACRTSDPPADGLMAVGVKFSPDGGRVSLAVCLKPDEGSPYVEVVASRSTSRGTKWISRWVLERKSKIAGVVVDGKRGEPVVEQIKEGRFPKRAVKVPGSSDVARANAMLVEAVQSGELEHYGQPDLDAAATKCPKRRIGQDGFGFEDAEGADSTLIEACALAYREAMTTKRRPGRKAVVR